MRSATIRSPFVGVALLSISLLTVVLGSLTEADGPDKPAENSDPARLAAVEKGERLIKALSTTNRPPRLYDANEDLLPIFPKDFDWKEYARVRAALKDLDANSEEVWPTIVEHMTDTDYCFTVRFIDSAVNYSRGDVCLRLAQTWISDGYAGLMPGGDGQQFRLPGDNPKTLQEWCRARRGKTFVEMEIDAAEWAISTIQKEQREPREILDLEIAGIRERVAKLRKTNKPRRYEFFQMETAAEYNEKEAAGFRERAGTK